MRLASFGIGFMIGLVVIYGVAWFGMHILDQPNIFWIVNGIQ
jgi:hypothetical protein